MKRGVSAMNAASWKDFGFGFVKNDSDVIRTGVNSSYKVKVIGNIYESTELLTS
jgi:hypothetical protein